MSARPIKRNQLRPGLEFDHMGTIYRVKNFDRDRDLVLVENPESGYNGVIPWKIMRGTSRHPVQQKELKI